MSQNDIPVELDIESSSQTQETKKVNKGSFEQEKTVPVVIRWPWPAKSGTYYEFWTDYSTVFDLLKGLQLVLTLIFSSCNLQLR